ncbi:MAG: hypothetical protein ACPL4E_03785 [Thermoproteota archaeon]
MSLEAGTRIARYCVLRQCYRQKGYVTCAECAETNSCKELQNVGTSLEGLKRIKAVSRQLGGGNTGESGCGLLSTR